MDDARKRIADVMRHDQGRILSALVGNLRDFDLAEESLAEAIESALVDWARNGPPDRPRAWLISVARRKAIDRIRRQGRFAERLPDLELLAQADQETACGEQPEIPDTRLALIFACCHPLLSQKSQIALTLRTVCGLSTEEVARAFLDTDVAMGQRLSRAKAKLRQADAGFEVPGPEEWCARLSAVLAVIWQVYTACYNQPGPADRRSADLCDEAIYLSKLLFGMLPEEDEVRGLLALLLFIDSRRAARVAPDGKAISLAKQDEALWDGDKIAAGFELVPGLRSPRENGAFALQARINAEHLRNGPGGTHWRTVLALYDLLYERMPTPVIELNRIVAMAEIEGPCAGLAALAGLEESLSRYCPFHAARADLLARSGAIDEALGTYDTAIALAPSPADARLLQDKRDELASFAARMGKKKAETSSAKSNREV